LELRSNICAMNAFLPEVRLNRVVQNMRAVLAVTYLAVIFSFNAKGSFALLSPKN
jgi:hypothetical protein